MAHGCTNAHLAYLAAVAITGTATRPSTFSVALYDDDADDLGNDATFGDIDTEPSDGNYTRASVDMDQVTATQTANHTLLDGPEAEFDLTDTTGEVDSAVVAWDYDGSEQIMHRQELDGRYDLADWSGITTVGVRWKHASVY